MSPPDIKPEDLTVRVLKPSDDLSEFDCSKDDSMGLNEFIHSEATDYQKEKLGVTHLFLYDNQIIGFATLAMSEIEIKEAAFLLSILLPSKVTIKDYPTMLIGRLAIHNDFRDRNVGKSVCLWCLDIAKKLSQEIGCKFVIVMTEGKPVEFYRKVGFEVFPKYEKKPKKWMYLKIP
jgi:predicted GNAT family N-acyltransferase